jgi:hypothetical protein
MKRESLLSALLAAAFVVTAAAQAGAQGTYAVKSGATPSTTIPAALQSELVAQGYTVTDSQGKPLLELWTRKDLPVKAGSPTSDILYPGLTPGELVGVVSFPAGTTDFRGDNIKPGVYTLRYELVPTDGNHVGVSNNKDFVLTVPASNDPGATTVMSFDQMVAASKGSTGANHPGVFNLVAAQGQAPSIADDGQGHQVLTVNVPTSGGQPLALGIIVVGKSDAAQ